MGNPDKLIDNGCANGVDKMDDELQNEDNEEKGRHSYSGLVCSGRRRG